MMVFLRGDGLVIQMTVRIMRVFLRGDSRDVRVAVRTMMLEAGQTVDPSANARFPRLASEVMGRLG